MSVGHDGTAFPQAVAERLTSPSPGWRRQGRWSWKPSRRKGWGTYPLVTYRVSMEPDAVVVALTARFGKPADAVGQAIIYRPDLANSPQSRTPGERTTAIGMGGSVANGPTGVTVSVSE